MQDTARHTVTSGHCLGAFVNWEFRKHQNGNCSLIFLSVKLPIGQQAKLRESHQNKMKVYNAVTGKLFVCDTFGAVMDKTCVFLALAISC